MARRSQQNPEEPRKIEVLISLENDIYCRMIHKRAGKLIEELLTKHVKDSTRQYGNVQTAAICHEITHNTNWRQASAVCDDWFQLKAKLTELNMTTTFSGIRLRDSKIKWATVTMHMRTLR